MKYLAAVALVFALVAMPACAQHGGPHGGFSGHAASAPRGGFGASAPNHASGYRSFASSRSPVAARGLQRGIPGHPGTRPPYTGSLRYRHPYVSRNRFGFPYGIPNYGLINPYYLAYPDDTSYDDSSVPPNDAANEYGAPAREQEFQGPLAPYPSSYTPASPAPAPTSEEAVTLIFKDGRPPEQIHNYILTRSTLYVGDQQHRSIPTDQLDLAATAKANEDAGVEFQLPNALK